MSSYPRAFFAYYTVALAALFLIGAPFAISPAAASPVPFPLVTYFGREYSANSVQDSHPGTMLVKNAFTNTSELAVRRINDTSINARDINTFVGNIGILNNYYTQMTSHASNLRESDSHI